MILKEGFKTNNIFVGLPTNILFVLQPSFNILFNRFIGETLFLAALTGQYARSAGSGLSLNESHSTSCGLDVRQCSVGLSEICYQNCHHLV